MVIYRASRVLVNVSSLPADLDGGVYGGIRFGVCVGGESMTG